MSTHIGTLSTEIELTADPAASQLRGRVIDERRRLQQQLRRERWIAARTRAEGFDD